MTEKIGHFIDGKAIAGSTTTTGSVFNPATGTVIAEVSYASKAEVENAISAAKNAYPAWAETSPLKRARVLFKFRELLEKNTAKLAALVTAEHGKVLADAEGSVLRGIELVEYACGIPALLRGTYSENVASQVDCYTLRQSLGVCAGVSPFNFPVMVPIWMFVSAIACGNTFVLKPSEKDPSAPMFMAELLMQAGLPKGVFNIVNGDKIAVEALLNHPDIQTMTAVASTPTAKHIYQTAIANGKRAHTFGGAKNHCIVMPDADVKAAAQAIQGAAFGSAGERCMALSVAVAVGDKTADALIAELEISVPQLKIGPGTEPGIEMGPLVTAEHLQKVLSYVDAGVAEGATLVVDGRAYKSNKPTNHTNGYFMGGCLFDNVTPTMKIYREEIFGPVLCVVRVADFRSALTLINENPYGNGTAIFTQDGETARTFAHEVQVGMVGINVPIPVPAVHHIFGGWKQSVFGDLHMHGDQSIQFYTKAKSVTSRWPKNVKTAAQYNMPHNKE
jgi:malonate-semialdehyde dehydrogenase (acetylating)/methylmalonate-semialdehyde dehydrogenase